MRWLIATLALVVSVAALTISLVANAQLRATNLRLLEAVEKCVDVLRVRMALDGL